MNLNPIKTLFFSTDIITNKRISAFIGFLCAIFLSAFIYLDIFLSSALMRPLSTLMAFFGLFLYFKLSRFGAFICGGVIGILWFYWIGLSFRFYDLSLFIPFVFIVLFLVYGGLFFLFCYFKNPIYRLFTLLFSSFIHPFGFNWFIIEAIFIKSYFFSSRIMLFCFLVGVILFSILLAKRFFKTNIIFTALFMFFLTTFFPNTTQSNPTQTTLKIKTTHLNVPQRLHWNANELNTIITQNFNHILEAKNASYDMVVLPETAFPIAINLTPNLINTLKTLSQEITILTGGVRKEQQNIYNSAYVFHKGEMQIFDKLILVPFGEKIPLPSFLSAWINKVIFKGSSDFKHNPFTAPNSIEINGEYFNIAICYEATREEFYQNAPKHLIAISNNAWFAPSIQANLQKLLMLYFAKKHNTTIYHSSNASENFTLTP